MPEQEVDAVATQSEDTQQDAGFFSAAVAAINEQQEGGAETSGEQVDEQNVQPEQQSDVSEQSQDSPEAEEPADITAEDQGETEVAEAQQDSEAIPDKENPDRFQYWQSKAQKYESQYGGLDEDTVDLANNIRQNPEILKAVEQAISGGTKQTQSPSAPAQEQEKAELTKPQRPVKPGGYNRMDAVSDPESESAQYEQSLIEYQEDLTDYLEAKDQRKEQELAKQRQLSEEQQAIEAEKKRIAAELQQGYGYNDQQANDFFAFLENQPNNLDSYRKLYEASKGIGEFAKPKAPQNKSRSQTSTTKQNSNPLPAGIGGGAPQKKASDGGFFGG